MRCTRFLAPGVMVMRDVCFPVFRSVRMYAHLSMSRPRGVFYEGNMLCRFCAGVLEEGLFDSSLMVIPPLQQTHAFMLSKRVGFGTRM